MPPLLQVKCTRCLCSHSYEQDAPELAQLDERGCGLPRKGIKQHCPCECHHLNPVNVRYPKLISRTLDFGDEPPY